MQYALLALIGLWLLYMMKQHKVPVTSKTGGMTKEEARQILGVSQDASKEEIQEAYQSLLKKLHPDTGGSDYLTQQIVAAKKVLDDE